MKVTPEMIYASHEIGRTFIDYAKKHPNEFPGLYFLGVFKPDLIESVINRLRWRMGW